MTLHSTICENLYSASYPYQFALSIKGFFFFAQHTMKSRFKLYSCYSLHVQLFYKWIANIRWCGSQSIKKSTNVREYLGNWMNTLTYFNYWFGACLPELTRRSFASHVHEEGSSSYHSYYWQTTEKDRQSISIQMLIKSNGMNFIACTCIL